MEIIYNGKTRRLVTLRLRDVCCILWNRKKPDWKYVNKCNSNIEIGHWTSNRICK